MNKLFGDYLKDLNWTSDLMEFELIDMFIVVFHQSFFLSFCFLFFVYCFVGPFVLALMAFPGADGGFANLPIFVKI
jgi:hypothetical protein